MTGPKMPRAALRAAAWHVTDSLHTAAKMGMEIQIRDGALFVGEYAMRPDGAGGLIVTVTKPESSDGKTA